MNIRPERRQFLQFTIASTAGCFFRELWGIFKKNEMDSFQPGEYVGDYDLVLPAIEPEMLEVYKSGHRLFLKIPSQGAKELTPLGQDEFLVADSPHRVVFNRLGDGRVDSTTLFPGILQGVFEPVNAFRIDWLL